MSFIEVRVEPNEDGWTVRHERGLFERFPRARDALKRALSQAASLRRRGHEARVRLRDPSGTVARRMPKRRAPGGLPPYDC